MDYGAIEDEIVAFLTTRLADDTLEIIAMPETEAEFPKSYNKRRLIVAFNGEDANPNQNLYATVHNTAISFAISVQGKFLRGVNGVYKLAEDVKQTLIGFRPANVTQLEYVSHKFMRNDKDIFEYVIDFKTEGTRIQNIPDETGDPFKYLTLTD